jgi:predicted nucleic acid-binding protein
MGSEACSDTGPILQLRELGHIHLLRLFSKILITHNIKEELDRHKVKGFPKNVETKAVNKDQVALISQRFNLDMAESSGIFLSKSLKIPIFLTDDLEAREAAISLNLKPVGTIGVIIRCFRDKMISKHEAIIMLNEVYDKSSLFVTSQLIKYAIQEIKKFKR